MTAANDQLIACLDACGRDPDATVLPLLLEALEASGLLDDEAETALEAACWRLSRRAKATAPH